MIKQIKKIVRFLLFLTRTKTKIPFNTKISKHVKIKANQATIFNHVKFGKHIYIKCNNISIGRGVVIGNDVKITGIGNVIIGNYSVISDDVFIDGFPNSTFKIGQLSWIGRQSTLNCSANLTIGNGTCVGIGSKIFTHGCWYEAAEGYKLNYQDVSIGNNVWLAVGVTVQPGSIIEDDVFVNSGAVVSGTLTSGFIYSGIPAKQKSFLNEIKNELSISEKMGVIAYYLSSRLVNNGWIGDLIEDLRLDHFYIYKKSARTIKIIFVSHDFKCNFNPECETIYFLPETDADTPLLAQKSTSVLIVDMATKMGYGSEYLEYLVLNALRDSIFRFYS